MVIFAGFTDQGRFDDTWKFSLNPFNWTNVTPPGMRPAARCLHSGTYDSQGDLFLIYGGQVSGPLDDIWAFDLSTNTWADLTPVNRPAGRLFSSITALGNGKAVVFGGYTNLGEVDELWLFTIVQRTWDRIILDSPPPPERQGHTAIYVPQMDWLVIFGGNTATETFNDVWVLENVSSL